MKTVLSDLCVVLFRFQAAKSGIFGFQGFVVPFLDEFQKKEIEVGTCSILDKSVLWLGGWVQTSATSMASRPLRERWWLDRLAQHKSTWKEQHSDFDSLPDLTLTPFTTSLGNPAKQEAIKLLPEACRLLIDVSKGPQDGDKAVDISAKLPSIHTGGTRTAMVQLIYKNGAWTWSSKTCTCKMRFGACACVVFRGVSFVCSHVPAQGTDCAMVHPRKRCTLALLGRATSTGAFICVGDVCW